MTPDLAKQALEALENYVTTIATAGGGDKQLFMAAIREADEKARAAIVAVRKQMDAMAAQVPSTLPPLPEPDERTRKGLAFSGFAMESYARAALRAYRESQNCWCLTCRPLTMNDMRFVVCPDCGNKRCPKANDHRNVCTGSNEPGQPGQPGSAYPAPTKESP